MSVERGLAAQRPSEAELVTVRIGDMAEPLAPFRVARRGIRAMAGRDEAGMQAVDVGVIENNAPPPMPISLGRLRDKIEIAAAGAKTGEACVLPAIYEIEAQHPIEAHGARHVVRRERDGADAFDHPATLACWFVTTAATRAARDHRAGKTGPAAAPWS